MIDRRRALKLLAGGAATSLLAVACKRKEMPKVELFDEDGTPPETEAISALAPPWPPAERAVLGNDLLVHWLTEEGSPAAHIRVLVPTHGLEDKVAPGAAAVVAEAIAIESRRWTARYGTTVDIAARVDRFEIAIHGPDLKFDAMLAALGRVVAVGDVAGLLERAQVTVAAGLPGLDGDVLALTALVGLLSGRDPARERLTKELIEALDADALADAWRELLDPKRVMLAVHAGRPVREEAMARLAKVWTRGGLLGGLGKASEEALDRLRPPTDARDDAEKGAPEGRRLRGAGAAPLRLLETSAGDRSGSLLLFGRVVPLADPRERAVARLAQRLLQEELDARLTIVGDRGLFVVRTPIRKSAPASDDDDRGKEKRRDKDKEGPSDPRARFVADFLDDYQEFVRARHGRNRIAQAAELWLGARMVQASLTGEDWTALWSESIDLARSDSEIAGALARDAQAMLAITPEELAEWSTTWLDVAKGAPGWAWIAASSEPDIGQALAQIAAVEPLRTHA
ncbi:MAG: hypothetical protein KC486_34825 [Myxococcales bacterium]|nr:hypothetical protein [Myxococcales bacterium]